MNRRELRAKVRNSERAEEMLAQLLKQSFQCMTLEDNCVNTTDNILNIFYTSNVNNLQLITHTQIQVTYNTIL